MYHIIVVATFTFTCPVPLHNFFKVNKKSINAVSDNIFFKILWGEVCPIPPSAALKEFKRTHSYAFPPPLGHKTLSRSVWTDSHCWKNTAIAYCQGASKGGLCFRTDIFSLIWEHFRWFVIYSWLENYFLKEEKVILYSSPFTQEKTNVLFFHIGLLLSS